jgi:hypothetical protein
VRGLLMGSVLTACLAASVGQALAAPDLDPSATYVYDAANDVTVITTPNYSIGPWATVRQTYGCNGGVVRAGPNGWGFQNLVASSVTAAYNGWNRVGDSFSDFSLLLTNRRFSAGQYQIRYRCSGYVVPWVRRRWWPACACTRRAIRPSISLIPTARSRTSPTRRPINSCFGTGTASWWPT